MADPYVTSATITDGKITLSILVNAFTPGEYVEISVQATQTSGAFANFYDIQQVPAQPNGNQSDPNDKDNFYIYVTGAPTPHQFREDEDFSAFARLSKLWLTVLGADPETTKPTLGQAAPEGTKWTAKRVSQINGGSW
jgi:hypothetical protein